MVKYILLGVIQGITEFLPVSSSAHLVIMQKILGLGGEEAVLAIVLHLGTCLALIVFFFADIKRTLGNKKILSYIIIVTIITGIIGITGKNFFERLFSSVTVVALGLIVTGIILILTRKFMHARRSNLTVKDAIILGITQGIAIIPGISRSGITISTLLFRKIDRETSFRFSFLASIPAVIGASLLEAKDIGFALRLEPINFTIGFILSFFTGLLSLRILKIALRKANLYYFGYYCIVLAIIALLFK
jgi:undecaprenyl-diphosphatase